MRRLLAAAAVALTLGACGGDDGGGDDPAARTTATPPGTTRDEVVANQAEGGFDARKIYDEEAPGVVTIVSRFGSEAGEGSGFVLNEAGEIVTNAHVIATGEDGEPLRRADEVYVEFADGNRVEAKVLGQDPNADVALLRVDPKGLELNPLPLGSSEDVEVGEPVAAIGSPFGQAQSLSVGIVSAKDRAVASLTEFAIAGAIQTDAAINPGNSGGPLVNAAGEVIGINQQIQSRSGGGEGVGFAVPIDTVKRSTDQLRESGTAKYAYLGVSSVPLYPQLVEHFQLDVDKGAWVQLLNPGSPAADAGLKAGSGRELFQGTPYARGGDVITELADQPIESSDDLSNALARYKPGETVKVEIHRGGQTQTLDVKLGERPAGTSTGG